EHVEACVTLGADVHRDRAEVWLAAGHIARTAPIRHHAATGSAADGRSAYHLSPEAELGRVLVERVVRAIATRSDELTFPRFERVRVRVDAEFLVIGRRLGCAP